MLHEEKKHFPSSSQPVNPTGNLSVAASKVSPVWTKEDISSLKKGIVSRYLITQACTNQLHVNFI